MDNTTLNELLERAAKLISTMKNNKKAVLWLRDYENAKESEN